MMPSVLGSSPAVGDHFTARGFKADMRGGVGKFCHCVVLLNTAPRALSFPAEAEIIAFAYRKSVVAEDVVSRRHVEVEVR